MTSIEMGTPLCFWLVGLVISSLSGGCHGMKMEITRSSYDGIIPTSFNISCEPEVTGNCARQILAIKVAKNGSRTLATLHHDSKISINTLLRENVKGEGHIDELVSHSRFSVQFSQVLREDSGLYTCSAIYLDDWGNVQEEVATKNVTVDKQALEDVVRHLLGKLSGLEKKVDAQEKQLVAQDGMLNRQQLEIGTLNHRTTAFIDRESFSCAFRAGYSAKDKLMVGHTLRFRVGLFDVGNDFDTQTGVFTAPKKGLYVFHLTVRQHGGWYLYADLMANGAPIASLYAHDKTQHDQASTSTVVSLAAGDLVRPVVNAVKSSSHYLNNYHRDSLFTGYLLKRLD